MAKREAIISGKGDLQSHSDRTKDQVRYRVLCRWCVGRKGGIEEEKKRVKIIIHLAKLWRGGFVFRTQRNDLLAREHVVICGGGAFEGKTKPFTN